MSWSFTSRFSELLSEFYKLEHAPVLTLTIVLNGTIDFCATRAICERLFAYRKKQQWPPTVAKQPGWDALYAAQAEWLNVLETVDEAVAWANVLVAKISSSVQKDA